MTVGVLIYILGGYLLPPTVTAICIVFYNYLDQILRKV